MKTVKTIIDNNHLKKILALLEKTGTLDSTIEIKDKNEKGMFNKIFKNKFTILVTTCTDSQRAILTNQIFPIVTILGGICIA
jgi:hypothetical protein